MTVLQRFRRLFVICALPVHVWAVIAYLYDLPGLMLRMPAADFLAHGAYVLVFALFESTVWAVLATLLSLRLSPRHLPAAEAVLLTGGIWLMAGRAIPLFSKALQGMLSPSATLQAFKVLLTAVPVGYAATLLVLRRAFRNPERATTRMDALRERLATLAGLYVALDAVALLEVLWRNF